MDGNKVTKCFLINEIKRIGIDRNRLLSCPRVKQGSRDHTLFAKFTFLSSQGSCSTICGFVTKAKRGTMSVRFQSASVNLPI